MSLLAAISSSRRRSSAFSPALYSPSRWLSDTGTSAGIWSDISGNGRHVSETDTLKQPSIISNVVNSRQVRRFNGTSSRLFGGNATYSVSKTLFIVFKPASLSAAYTTIVDAYQTAAISIEAGYGYFIKSNGKTAFYCVSTSSSQPNYDGDGTSIITAGSWFISSIVWKSNNIESRINSSPDGSFTSTFNLSITETNKSIGIGYSPFFTGRYFNGDIAEIIEFNSALDSAQVNNIRNYLADYYGIAAALA